MVNLDLASVWLRKVLIDRRTPCFRILRAISLFWIPPEHHVPSGNVPHALKLLIICVGRAGLAHRSGFCGCRHKRRRLFMLVSLFIISRHPSPGVPQYRLRVPDNRQHVLMDFTPFAILA